MGTETLSDEAGPLPDIFLTTDDNSPWRRRFDQIHIALRQRITTLQYQPGTRLDVDRLSEEFGVSRTPVRNVLQRMDQEGLVVTRHGVGTIVAPLDLEQSRQAVQMRIELAPLIGVLDPKPIDDVMVAAIRGSRESYGRILDEADPAFFASADMELHTAVCRMIGNPLLLRTYDELYYRTARLWFHYLPSLDQTGEVSIFLNDIDLIVAAAEFRDVKGVGYALRNAIYNAFARLDHFTRA
ncbi:GntR family transcriptional regulator [Hoeflea poritis]|uniref:GntR family transcriptional regulator n=1 Tax=Hoeflea poritis TaxID=2993659 RepID=A0ABT4VGF3_9HYPH|nr:GntR family transcriptional regulator [Hoeflea poritis]MDA4843782.1 GntR family transcriptional regulator [Hoeflea poritis]